MTAAADAEWRTLRDEPGDYRVAMLPGSDGGFRVRGESSRPVTLTVRVEDAWCRLAPEARRLSYSVEVRRDGSGEAARLDDVAPDARIFIDFERSFDMEFT